MERAVQRRHWGLMHYRHHPQSGKISMNSEAVHDGQLELAVYVRRRAPAKQQSDGHRRLTTPVPAAPATGEPPRRWKFGYARNPSRLQKPAIIEKSDDQRDAYTASLFSRHETSAQNNMRQFPARY